MRNYLGIDIGSVSVKVVVIGENFEILEKRCVRTKGNPAAVARELVENIGARFALAGVASTGSGGKLLKAEFVNEIVAQSTAVGKLYPHIKTVIEIGGEDSKLLIMEKGKLKDFAANSVCAAGTGSFLDQQATRLGLSIEEFSRLALRSKRPPRIAGRCTVFAKSDMIHLQQKGTPDYDIVAGLCLAVARNFIGNVGRGKKIEKPVAFHGGVAANVGMVKAFECVIGLADGEVFIPEHFALMGAIGAVISCLENDRFARGDKINIKEIFIAQSKENKSRFHSPLGRRGSEESSPGLNMLPAGNIRAYLGIDVGSVSTNLALLDENKNVLVRKYLATAGRPIEAVKRGLLEIKDEIGGRVEVLGAGTTGSGRHMIGDLVGADIVKNEITAQAEGALHFEPAVDTIFEIGGQDSKYIALEKGAVVDFAMNKVCAAGTGSFLEEQAEKLGLNIRREFAEFAFASSSPCGSGDRCTVFMESELNHHLSRGAPQADLVAGLAYSIVNNYLNRVVENRRVGENILFQGGVAGNRAVVAAFEKITGKRITVPPFHDVTGAIGAALIARRERNRAKSKFKGFDLNKVTVESEAPVFDGKSAAAAKPPDLFAERDEIIFSYKKISGGKKIGLPRALLFYENFPFWSAFFSALGFEVVLSDASTPELARAAIENKAAEACFPITLSYGHVRDLAAKGADLIFLPSVIGQPAPSSESAENFNCPFIQALPYFIKAGFNHDNILSPPLEPQRGKAFFEKQLINFGRGLGKNKKETQDAIRQAQEKLREAEQRIKARGREVLKQNVPALAIISRSYNGSDPALNLNIPQKLREMGVLAIPADYLPAETEATAAMYWSCGQKILAAAKFVDRQPALSAVYITNFRCGPDSFISHLVKETITAKPYLQIEVDEHSSDTGIITRLEAFLESWQRA